MGRQGTKSIACCGTNVMNLVQTAEVWNLVNGNPYGEFLLMEAAAVTGLSRTACPRHDAFPHLDHGANMCSSSGSASSAPAALRADRC